QLTSGVATVPAVGAVRSQDPGRVEAAQERGLHAEELGGLAHRDGRVVPVVELSDSIAHSVILGRRRGPGHRPGPRRDQALISWRPLSAALMVILRGLAFSAMGMVRVSTPAS